MPDSVKAEAAATAPQGNGSNDLEAGTAQEVKKNCYFKVFDIYVDEGRSEDRGAVHSTDKLDEFITNVVAQPENTVRFILDGRPSKDQSIHVPSSAGHPSCIEDTRFAQRHKDSAPDPCQLYTRKSITGKKWKYYHLPSLRSLWVSGSQSRWYGMRIFAKHEILCKNKAFNMDLVDLVPLWHEHYEQTDCFLTVTDDSDSRWTGRLLYPTNMLYTR